MLDFNLTDKQKSDLVHSGRDAVSKIYPIRQGNMPYSVFTRPEVHSTVDAHEANPGESGTKFSKTM
jgi:hypothetical protein